MKLSSLRIGHPKMFLLPFFMILYMFAAKLDDFTRSHTDVKMQEVNQERYVAFYPKCPRDISRLTFWGSRGSNRYLTD